jgi:hypothetical protein
MTPANERKAKERKAKRDAGLVRVEVWVPASHADEIRGMADRLSISDAEAERIRRDAYMASARRLGLAID